MSRDAGMVRIVTSDSDDGTKARNQMTSSAAVTRGPPPAPPIPPSGIPATRTLSGSASVRPPPPTENTVSRSATLARLQRASTLYFLLCGPPPWEGAAYCVALALCLSVRPSRSGCTLFTVAPSYERTSKIEKLRFSLMGQRHVCRPTFRHAQRAAYRTAISAAQILVRFAELATHHASGR